MPSRFLIFSLFYLVEPNIILENVEQNDQKSEFFCNQSIEILEFGKQFYFSS